MQTNFAPARLEDPQLAEDAAIIRKCVHCGFCSATCPTYQLLGDELDSPRGRIYLIKEMLERDRPASAAIVRHLDRCLSCLACVTTCPSGVDYQHLIDHARVHVERTYRRPLGDRLLRSLLAATLPYPRRLKLILAFARPFRSLRFLFPARLKAMLELLPPAESSGPVEQPVDAADPSSKARVALLTGCVQSVMGRRINEATERLLERMGSEVLPLDGCCGAIVQHLGRDEQARAQALELVGRIEASHRIEPIDAIVVNASGCGTQLKDFRHLFARGADAERAATVTELARDVTEYVAEVGLPPVQNRSGLKVAYHSACSMQHGQKLHEPPRELLRAAGFEVVEISEGHLCCGSAGTYNMLQPEIASRLRAAKLEHIGATRADVVATGNLGCITQLRPRPGVQAAIPVVHTIELLDWATGGPRPAALSD